MKEVIFNLPDNLNTKIGDKDHFMSGGQIQRIAIARALYHERDILIFDESTNSLDEENEKNILNLLKQLSKEKTIIIISHRKNSFIYCNKIFLLKNQKLHNIN